jgi:hypothetical protein
LKEALQAIYPRHDWKTYKRFTFGHTSSHRGSKSQSLLFGMLKTLIPGTPIQSNYKLPLEEKKDTRLIGYEFDVSLMLHPMCLLQSGIFSKSFSCVRISWRNALY